MAENDGKLLAKSCPEETLLEHTINCLNVLGSIKELYPDVPGMCRIDDFFKHLFYAAMIHDLGKGAKGFQMQLRDGTEWNYRHEILSAVFAQIIEPLDEFSRRAVALAVITHHKDVSELKRNYGTADPFGIGKVEYFRRLRELEPNIPDVMDVVKQCCGWGEKILNEKIPTLNSTTAVEKMEDSYRYAVQWYNKLTEENGCFSICGLYGIFLRGFLIACDHLSSAGKDEVLKGICSVEKIFERDGFRLRPFQKKVGTVKGSAFLSAPTGSGKTEASLLWAGNNQDAGRRFYYVLPYTASINAMYARLVRYFGDEHVGILHGKASYFMYRSFLDRNYSPCDALQEARTIKNLTKKIYRPIKVLTPFQIIKAFFGVKGWEMHIAEMSGGLFIFDEIHVYDPHVTALLVKSVEYLSGLGAKFLFLSATFPDFLKKLFVQKLKGIEECFLDENDEEDGILLSRPRHRVSFLPGGILDHMQQIGDDLSEGKRVIVVCNTVKQAQSVFQELENRTDSAELLHGRFILRDREQKEKRLKDMKLLVGTQVVEVSLDIDFDTGYTEPAPIDALIQRFGRINRKGEKGVVPVHIFTEGSDKDKYFYDSERIKRTLEVFSDGEELTEKRVSELVQNVYNDGYNKKEEEIYSRAYEAFDFMVKAMRPFCDSEKEFEFEELIRSIEVVPKKFEKEFIQYKEEKKHFDAMQFLASLSLGQAAKLNKLEMLERRKDGYWVADTRYDERLGLMLGEIETNFGNVD